MNESGKTSFKYCIQHCKLNIQTRDLYTPPSALLSNNNTYINLSSSKHLTISYLIQTAVAHLAIPIFNQYMERMGVQEVFRSPGCSQLPWSSPRALGVEPLWESSSYNQVFRSVPSFWLSILRTQSPFLEVVSLTRIWVAEASKKTSSNKAFKGMYVPHTSFKIARYLT